jgi:serine/threonine protein kinase
MPLVLIRLPPAADGLDPKCTAMTSRVQEGTLLLGKYRVEKELGSGAMGYVVAARHEHLGELFAVKLMLPEALQHPDAAGRFLREARACARLKNEHVVRVTDSGEHEGGIPVMVMEYLEGEDLQSVLEKRKAFPFNEAALYVLQACEGIAEAHELGIVHRDLKPSNLFLTSRPNGKPCVKVLDFGISKALDDGADIAPRLTATGSVMGTPYYMSPEQLKNSKATDARSDIWALGVILYEFVTGEVPFGGETYAEISGRALFEQPKAPSSLRTGIPSKFDALVLRCLEKQPENRFSSVRELMAALEPFATVIVTLASDSNVPSGAEVDKRSQDKDAMDATLPVAPAAQDAAAPNRSSDDGANQAQVFYAKRVFGHQARKSWAATPASRKIDVGAVVFLLCTIALAGVVWFYREKLIATVRNFGPTQAPSAMPSAEPDEAPSIAVTAASNAPKLPKVTTKPGGTPKTASPKTSSKTPTAPSPSAVAPSTSGSVPVIPKPDSSH